MNRFGKAFSFTTFGESHGPAVGCVIDGIPAGLCIDEAFIQSELDRRRPGQNKFATARKEGDKVEILSGVFEGLSTGSPIALVIFNENQKSGDYENVKDLFRPGHADFTYFHKYGIRDYRGGGRSSARETAARVAAGAVAKLLLKALHVEVKSGVCAIGTIEAIQYDFSRVAQSPIYALDASVEKAQEDAIMEAKNTHDSIGGVALVHIVGAPAGLGEPLYYKLDALLAEAMMGINGVKAIEIGEGFHASSLKGSTNNDAITKEGFVSNHSGGILGGISNGDTITCKVYFKPTPSIFIAQQTITKEGEEVECSLKGRHDPCIAVRGSVVAESMAALVVADLLLLNMGSRLEHLQKVYM
ncbi:MAG: chorismate synthase [Sulfurospirillaceae bacterium]|nr:chorismate synthase [Sulfurospirillaceae bacterium]MDD2827118.1 chorismate synthase [Sulfurospirillaceae bacterium]